MSFDNSDDIIDSRDIIARLEELQAAKEAFDETRQELLEALSYAQGAYVDAVDSGEHSDEIERLLEFRDAAQEDVDENAEEDFDDQDELDILEALESEAGGYGDWRHGETLIRRSYWVEYVEELVKDIGIMPRDIPGYIEIDWEATADNLEVDYMSVDFDGVEYLMRA